MRNLNQLLKESLTFRNSDGTFMSRRTFVGKTILYTLIGTIFVYGVTEGLVRINNWSYQNEIQKPVVILTSQGDVMFQIIKRPIIIKRKPLEVLSPMVKEVMQQQKEEEEMTPIEKKIVDKWGAKYGYIALAVARAESGLRCDALNINTNGTADLSIFQVNTLWLKHYSLEDIANCEKNIDIAYEIWDRADGVAGDDKGNFSPWVAYTNKAYLSKIN